MPEMRRYTVTETRTVEVATAHGFEAATALATRALSGAEPEPGQRAIVLPEQADRGWAERPRQKSLHIDPA